MKHWKTPARLLTATALLGASSACVDSTAPVVPDPRLLVDLSAGGEHTCAVTVESTVLCWGSNRVGQLGDGTTVDRFRPTPASAPSHFTRVAAGGSATCALTAEGIAYCWGDNWAGLLGVASPESQVGSPLAVHTGTRFVDIVLGSGHTCALDADGRAYCWGNNHYGQVGGTHPDSLCGTECARTPTPVPGDLRFSSLAATRSHTCGVTEDGGLYCWGLNETAQLGAVGSDECDPWEQGSVPCSRSPVRVAGARTWARVTAGDSHTCALTHDGAAYCWGAWGPHMGDWQNSDEWMRRTPEPVSDALRFKDIAAGPSSTCGAADDGRTLCWGYGKLGSAEGADPALPEALDTSARFREITAGGGHMCGLTPEGIAYCWGVNRYGQLGDPSGALSWWTPVVVKGW